MTTLNEFKEKAFAKFGNISREVGWENEKYKNPIDFLYSLQWNIPTGPSFDQEVLSEMNIQLDEKSCFGRAVKAAVISETLFPNHTLFIGEVCSDLLKEKLLENATLENWNDETFISELLMYEEPHLVLLYDKGEQFDPLFKIIEQFYPRSLKHPSIIRHKLWEGLHSSYLVSEALLAKNEGDLEKYVEILQTAHPLYPEVVLVWENLAAAHCFFGEIDTAISLAEKVSQKRMGVKVLYFLWSLTHDAAYKNKIVYFYGPQMFNFLHKKYES